MQFHGYLIHEASNAPKINRHCRNVNEHFNHIYHVIEKLYIYIIIEIYNAIQHRNYYIKVVGHCPKKARS